MSDMGHSAENGAPGPETCPSLCVERSHPGSEHDPAEHGCYCWELCSMGPTCPGANAGLDHGCWRTLPQPSPLFEALAEAVEKARATHVLPPAEGDA